MPTPSRRASAGDDSRAAVSPMRTSPLSGCTAPARIFIRVDLPAPFSPTTACTVPASTARSTPTRAWIPPYALRRPVTAIAGGEAGTGVLLMVGWGFRLLGLGRDRLDVVRPVGDLPVDERLVVLAGRLGRGRDHFQLVERQRRKPEGLLHA